MTPGADAHPGAANLKAGSKSVTPRDVWVDYAKGIGIILVVYGHVARGVSHAGMDIDRQFFQIADSTIYSFHMPLFFFISGLFLLSSMAKRDPVSMLRVKADVIVYPYVIWSLLQGTFEVVLSSYSNGHATMGEVFSLFWSPRAQFWFLYVLFFMFALALLVYRRSSLKWASGVFSGALLLYFLDKSLPGIYLIQMLCHFFVFFSAGVLLSFLPDRPERNRGGWLIVFLVIFAVLQWLTHAGGLSQHFGSSSGVVLQGLAGIGMAVLLAQWLTRFNLRWLAFIGRQSMVIYLAHILAGSGCRIVLHKLLGISDVSVHLLVGTLAGLLLPLWLYVGSERFGLGALFSPPGALSLSRKRSGTTYTGNSH